MTVTRRHSPNAGHVKRKLRTSSTVGSEDSEDVGGHTGDVNSSNGGFEAFLGFGDTPRRGLRRPTLVAVVSLTAINKGGLPGSQIRSKAPGRCELRAS